jgi:hypothetical protein
VHRAINARYLDANYAGVFIMWDKMFGSFAAEDASEPPRYGIVKNLATFNPLKVALHEWLAMFADLSKSRSLKDIGFYFFGPPGWSPDGSRDTSKTIKARWQAFRSAQIAEKPSPAE